MHYILPSRRLLATLACFTMVVAGCRQTGLRIPGFPERQHTGSPTPLFDNSSDESPSPRYEELPPSPSAGILPTPHADDLSTRPAGFEDGAEHDENATENRKPDSEPLPVIIPARPRRPVLLREPEGPIARLETPGPQLDPLQFLAELTADTPAPTPPSAVSEAAPAQSPPPQPVAVVRGPSPIESWPREGAPTTIIVCPGPVARSLVQPVSQAVRESRSWGIGTFE